MTRCAIRMISYVTEGELIYALCDRRGRGRRGGRPKPWPQAPRGARGKGALSPPRKNSAAAQGGYSLGVSPPGPIGEVPGGGCGARVAGRAGFPAPGEVAAADRRYAAFVPAP